MSLNADGLSVFLCSGRSHYLRVWKDRTDIGCPVATIYIEDNGNTIEFDLYHGDHSQIDDMLAVLTNIRDAINKEEASK